INLSGGYLILALLLIFLVVSVLGTGIPTTPAYILAVTVGGAALQRLGVDILAAHLFVFYYAVLADVTPPVAVTAFAGAQMAAAGSMFRPLTWPQRVLLIAVSLAAISPQLAVSVVTSLVLLAFGVWDWSRARRDAVRPVSVGASG